MSKIKIANEQLIISSIIQDHPRWIWVRELTQNGIEAISEYLKNNPLSIPQDIKIRCLDVKNLIYMNDDDTKPILKNKLSFLNPGGMDQHRLIQMIDMASSGKTQSLDGSYGIGMKSSTLGWTQLLIISYKDGVGHCVGLKKVMIDHVNFYINTFTEDDVTGYPTIDCTEWIKQNAEERAYDLNQEFTEVIILGNTPQQNTFEEPIEGELTKTNHIRRSLARRYWRTPKHINIALHQSILASKDAKNQEGYRNFITYEEAFELAKKNKKNETVPKNETVSTSDGYKIHYFYDPACGKNYTEANNPATHMHLETYGWASTFSGLIWRNEIFDIKDVESGSWRAVAPYIGIEDNFKYFRVFVEVPDNFLTDKYRTHLKKDSKDYTYDCRENLIMIEQNMPEWFKDLVAKTRLRANDSLKDRLQKLLDQYKGLNIKILGMPGQSIGVGGGNKKGGGTVYPPNPNPNPNPKPRQPRGGFQLPEMIEATESQVKEYDIAKHFACVVTGDKGDKIIYNPKYPTIENIVNGYRPGDSERIWITDIVKDQLILQTAIYVCIHRDRSMRKLTSFDQFRTTTLPIVIDTYLDTILVTLGSAITDEVQSERRRLHKSESLKQAV